MMMMMIMMMMMTMMMTTFSILKYYAIFPYRAMQCCSSTIDGFIIKFSSSAVRVLGITRHLFSPLMCVSGLQLANGQH